MLYLKIEAFEIILEVACLNLIDLVCNVILQLKLQKFISARIDNFIKLIPRGFLAKMPLLNAVKILAAFSQRNDVR